MVMGRITSLSYGFLKDQIERELEFTVASLDYGKLREMLNYALFPAGKRVRPYLLCEVTAALSGGVGEGFNPQDLIRAAAAIELIHTASLVHDDLPSIDNDLLRRGKPAFHVQYGEGNAVLMGDLITSLAFVKIAEITDSIIQAGVLKALSDANRDVQIGQLLDIQNVRDIESLKSVHALKTASLFRACGEIAAIISSGSPLHIRESAIHLSYHFGLLFQAMNDRQDVSVNEREARVAGSDISTGRGTVEGWSLVDRRQYFAQLIEEIKRHLYMISEAVGPESSSALSGFLDENLSSTV